MEYNNEKVCVIIPTYNRIESIALILDNINRYCGSLFVFEIHDSSTSEGVRELIVNSGISKDKLAYYHCSSEISADYKAATAVLSCNERYIWLMGDGIAVDFNEIDHLLLSSSYNDYSIIEVIPQKKGMDENILHNVDDFGIYFERNFSHLTFWGASILRKEIFEWFFSEKKNVRQYVEDMRWWIARAIFEYISYEKNNDKEIRVGYLYSSSVKGNPHKKDHYWTNGETYYLWAIKMLNEAVFSLPEMYDSHKIQAIINFRNDRLVSNRYLLKLRAKGTLTLRMVRKYKAEIIVAKGFYYKMIYISCIPCNIFKAIERTYYWMLDRNNTKLLRW